MNTTKYNEKYHNNKFNFLISKKSDMYRSIIDIDGLITKRDKNIKYCLMYDHKNNNDNPSINTLKELSSLVGVTRGDGLIIKCFIVRSEINILNDNQEVKTDCEVTTVYEIKKWDKHFNKSNKLLKHADFIEKSFDIRSDSLLIKFFQPETHEEVYNNFQSNPFYLK